MFWAPEIDHSYCVPDGTMGDAIREVKNEHEKERLFLRRFCDLFCASCGEIMRTQMWRIGRRNFKKSPQNEAEHAEAKQWKSKPTTTACSYGIMLFSFSKPSMRKQDSLCDIEDKTDVE